MMTRATTSSRAIAATRLSISTPMFFSKHPFADSLQLAGDLSFFAEIFTDEDLCSF